LEVIKTKIENYDSKSTQRFVDLCYQLEQVNSLTAEEVGRKEQEYWNERDVRDRERRELFREEIRNVYQQVAHRLPTKKVG
jgi:hypothetical protein